MKIIEETPIAYKALLYDNGIVEVIPYDDSNADQYINGVYTFVDCTKDDYRSGGSFAIRASAIEAVQALIDNLSKKNKELLDIVKENYEVIKTLKTYCR